MSFKPYPSKQAQEVIFSCNIKKPNHLVLIFNDIPINQTPYQNRLGIFLDDKLNFGEYLNIYIYIYVYITNKVNKSIGVLCKLQMIIPKQSLATIFKPFIRLFLTIMTLSLMKRSKSHTLIKQN